MRKGIYADRLKQNQGSLRSLIHIFAAQWVTTGLPPRSLLGDLFRETHIETQAFLRISDFHHAESRTAGAWLQSPKPHLSLRGGFKEEKRKE